MTIKALPLSLLSASVFLAFCSLSYAKTSSPEAVVSASQQVEAISGATQKREATSGAFVLTKTPEGKKLLADMAADFLYTGPSTFDGKKISGGRKYVCHCYIVWQPS